MNIEQYLDELIKREGGYVNIPADRGGVLSTELPKR
jgi:lysozyme family protein